MPATTVTTATTESARALLRVTARVNRPTAAKNRPASQSTTGRRIMVALSAMRPPSRRDDSAGMTVTATRSDSSTVTEMATAMSRNIWPTSSWVARIGRNTMTVVSAETSTAPQTWRAPS